MPQQMNRNVGLEMRRVLSVPSTVQLNITGACNLRCIHCSAEVFRGKTRNAELSAGEWIGLIRRLRAIGVFRISFTGGEVFLRGDILDLLYAAGALGFGKLTVLTNATLVTPSVTSGLIGARVSAICVSLDGLRENHNRMRASESAFDDAVRGLKTLLAAGIPTEVAFTVTRLNYEDVCAVAGLLEDIGIRTLEIIRLVAQGRALANYSELSLRRDESRALRVSVEALSAAHSRLRVSYTPPFYECLPNIDRAADPCISNLKSCSAGHSSCCVTPDGWVIPCGGLVSFKAGNVRDNDILDIWNNAHAWEQIRRLSGLSMEAVPACRGCPYVRACGGGCRGHAYNFFGNLVSPIPDCPLLPARAEQSRLTSGTWRTGH